MIHATSEKSSTFKDIVSMGRDCLNYLASCDLQSYGEIMHDYWLIKKERQKSQTPETIIDLYDHLYGQNFIYGGKLVGAGGGGFILIATNQKNKIKEFLQKHNIRFVDFSIDTEGAKLLVS